MSFPDRHILSLSVSRSDVSDMSETDSWFSNEWCSDALSCGGIVRESWVGTQILHGFLLWPERIEQ